MEGIIGLEDGTILRGKGFGLEGWVAAEMCFNTSMTGYEEILTDPSYKGQVVALTCPEIGNTGINPEDEESEKPQVSGLVVRRLSRRASNWRQRETLDVYLRRHKIPAVEGVDTRALTRKLRIQGAMKGVLATNGMSGEEAVRKAKEWPGLGRRIMWPRSPARNRMNGIRKVWISPGNWEPRRWRCPRRGIGWRRSIVE